MRASTDKLNIAIALHPHSIFNICILIYLVINPVIREPGCEVLNKSKVRLCLKFSGPYKSRDFINIITLCNHA